VILKVASACEGIFGLVEDLYDYSRKGFYYILSSSFSNFAFESENLNNYNFQR
jgi:hypothetical protein